ncbi:hypothetical protein NQZ68_035893 [Dissostichus eleginoides]|nr:hypothetical protein NQZ68_035893 [Dissostichus eleginoides]
MYNTLAKSTLKGKTAEVKNQVDPEKTKDDPINLNYSEVDSSNSSAASLHSAPCGDADNVLSAPRGGSAL